MKNTINRIYIVSFGCIIGILAGILFFSPKKYFSEAENRILAQSPTFSIENLLSGEYTSKLPSFYSDQFPFRDVFIGTKAYFELLQGKSENNGVIYGKGNVLIPHTEILENRLYENLECIREFADKTDTQIMTVALPRVIDVYEEYLPVGYPSEENIKIWEDYGRYTEKQGIESINVYDVLCEKNLYYKTDHHYTSEGAFEVYRILGDKLGFVPKNKDFFKVETVTENFCGTSMRSSGFYLNERDKITLFRYENDTEYVVVADGKNIKLYDFSALDKTDKYAVFLGGNHSRVDITDGGNREKLLIIRDSFADSIVPFLSLHYDLIMIDLRYYTDSVAELVRQEEINKILILQNISEFATARNITLLRSGL